jgi:hypothetical protein
MLRAMNDNTLSNGRSTVFVSGNTIVRKTSCRQFVLREFSRADIAHHAMADVWCIACAQKGIGLGRLIRLINER